LAEELPPAVLDLIVNTAQWVESLQSSIASLEELDAAITETATMVTDFSDAMTIGATEAAAAMDEAAASIVLSSDEASAALARLGEAADASAAAQDAAAAASEGAAAKTASSSEAFGAAGASIGSLAEKAGLAVAAVGAASLTMAGDFQASVTRLVTSAGESSNAVGMISSGLLDMSTKVGFTANEMAKAMYPIESAGYHAADGLKVMQAAAEGAKDEGADLSHVADAVTTVMRDYNLTANDAGDVTSKMVKAISFGKTNFDAFSKSLATVLPIAASVGLSFADVASVEAAMTAHGTTAQRAAMDVAAAIKSLIAPTTQMTKEFTALDITGDQVQAHLGKDGLAGTLEWLRQTAEKNAAAVGQTVPEAMKKLIGTSPGLQAALEATDGSADSLTQAIKAVGAATTDTNGDVLGFSEVQGNLSFAFAKFKAQLEATAISIGNVMMPAMVDLLKLLDDTFKSMSGDSAIGEAFKEVVVVIGEAFHAMAPMMAPLANLFRDLVKVIGELLVDVLQVISPALGALFDGLDAIAKAIIPLLPLISDIAKAFGEELGTNMKTLVESIKPLLPPLTELTKVLLASVLKTIKDLAPAFEDFAKSLVEAVPSFATLIPVITDVVKQLMPFLDALIKVTAAIVEGLAWAIDKASKGLSDFVIRTAEVGKWIADLPKKLNDAGKAFGQWAIDLPKKIGDALNDLGKTINAKWDDATKSLKKKANDSVNSIADSFNNLPYKVGHAIGELIGTVQREANKIGQAIIDGVKSGTEAVGKYFSVDLPKKIKDSTSTAKDWLDKNGQDVINGFLSGVEKKALEVWKWFQDLPKRIDGFFTDAGHWLFVRSMEVIAGFLNGLNQAADNVWKWFRELPGKILNWLNNANTWLINTGFALVQGLAKGIWNGAGWLNDQIMSFANGIIQGFKDAFQHGSPSKRMASEVGIHLTTGIAMGMLNGMPAIRSAVNTIANELTRGGNLGLNTGSLGLPRGMAGLAAGGAGGGVLIINNNVQGSVVAEKQIRQLNQSQTLQYNLRNPTNGLSLFGRGTV
jgi:TP901 family phage tail tape measure protein